MTPRNHELMVWTAVLAPLGAGGVYLVGLAHAFVWDIQETCQLGRGERYDPSAATGGTFFPLSQRCNADYDLVPGFINPTVVGLLVLAIVAAILATNTPPAPTDPSQQTS